MNRRKLLHCTLLLFLLVNIPVFSQTPDFYSNLKMDGTVVVAADTTTKPLKGVTINILADSVLDQSYCTEEDGFHKFILEFDKEYHLIFSKKHFHSKTIVVNTHNVPVEEKQFGFGYGGYKVELIRKEKLKDATQNSQVGYIYYDTLGGGFNHKKPATPLEDRSATQ